MSTVINLRRTQLPDARRVLAPTELTYLLDLAAELKAAKRQRREEKRLCRQADRADLREGLHAHALRLRGRRARPGRARDVHRPGRLAHGTQGDGQGHGARARAHVRRDRVPRLRRGRRRRARRLGGRARLQRPHRRVAPDADPRRLPDAARARRQAAREIVVLLPGRRALQHGRLLPGRRREARHGRPHREPTVALAGHAIRRARALDGRADRSHHHDHARASRTPCAAATRSPPTSGCRWASPRRRGRSASASCCPTRSMRASWRSRATPT